MNTFQILWMVAGAVIGYYVPQVIVVAACKRPTPVTMDLAFAFVGVLVAYTFTR